MAVQIELVSGMQAFLGISYSVF